MGQFRDYLETGAIDEARDKSVSTEFRIAMGVLKRLYNPKEVPEKNKLKDDAEDVAKKYKLDIKTFVKYALEQYGLNEENISQITWSDAKQAAKDSYNVLKKAGFTANQKSENSVRLKHKNGCVGQLVFDPHLNEENLDEAAVGQKGRTSYKEAMNYCEENEELVDEFRKIIKKLGGKTVAKALLDKLSQKPEIKDEIDHIEDIIDNSNY